VKGVVIAGTGSGVGKTSIAAGLMARLSERMKVQGFKVGPDFIDPMYHSAATGRHARNLDSFMMPKGMVKAAAVRGSAGADISVIEGVRGLYEGSSGKDDSGSTAEIAKLLGLPVVLVINARSLTRSAAAIAKGFISYDKEVNIAGVIPNNVYGVQHERKLREAMEDSGIRVLGIIGRDAECWAKDRNPAMNTDTFDKEKLSWMERMTEGVDLDQLIDVCDGPENDDISSLYTERDTGLRAAVPMDDAFCFYYRENIECMEASGVRVEYFSPLNGDMLPDADIYYLGGGHPELHMERLSENRDFFQGLKTACSDKKVIIGEGGGMLSLCSSFTTNGRTYGTAGVFDAEAEMTGKRHGPYYVIARPNGECGLFGGKVRGHEFHYSTVRPGPGCRFGFDLLRGGGLSGKKDGMVCGNALGTYMHQHALSTKDWMGGIADIRR
jgi:cobyrinic acid a,c-diamide synthase